MKKKTETRKICDMCETVFFVYGKSKRELEKRFCCKECSSRFNGLKNKGRHHSEETKEKMSESMSGENNPFYGKTHTEQVRKLLSERLYGKTWDELYGAEEAAKRKEELSEKMSGEGNYFYGKVHTEESRALMSSHHDNRGEKNPNYGNGDKLRGERNPSWMGGISFGEYGYEFNEALKSKIRKRDNYCCAICENIGFVVHHIDYNKKNNEEKNLITLCRSCHGKTGFRRENWVVFFNSFGCNNEKI